MRTIYLFLVIALIISCERDVVTSGLIKADIDNQPYQHDGYAYLYNDFQNGKNIGHTYNILNLDDTVICITIFDSTFSRLNFSYPQFDFKYTEYQPDDLSKSYQIVSGNINFAEERHGNLEGTFSCKLINLLDNHDTVHIDNGYLNIPLQKFNRTR